MALDPREAEALAGQAESGGRVLAVGHTAVHHPGLPALLAAVASEPLDTARRAVAVRTSSGYADGRSNPALDLCPHDLAIATLLFGSPVAARARCRRASVEYEIRFQGDALLSGRAEWCEPPHTRRFEVVGARSLTDIADPTPDVRNSPLGRQCVDFIDCCRTRRQPLSNGRLGVEVARCLAALSASSADGNAWVPLDDLVPRSSFIVHRSEVA